MNINIKTTISINPVKEDTKLAAIKLVRINPNGEYGTYVHQDTITKEQRIEIEKILGITIKDYICN